MLDISVVITCYNRKQYLEYALASFMAQTFPMNRFEVIVVDDGSTDGTIPYMKSRTWPFRLKTVRLEANKGISYARNRGIDMAEGAIVAFSDSDMIVPRDYLEQHWRTHQKEEKLVVSAPYRYHVYTVICQEQLNTKLWDKMVKRTPELLSRIPETFPEDGRPIPVLSPDEILNGFLDGIIDRSPNSTMSHFMSKYPNLNDCPMPWLAYAGSNSSVPRKSLLEIGGFDEDLRFRHDDRDIGYRLYLTGHQFFLHTGIIATHQDHLLSKDRQRMDYLSFHDLALMLRKHPSRDMFLFGLYQTEKSLFKPPFLAELKAQIMKIEKKDKQGKNDVRRMEELVRHHVLRNISLYLQPSPLEHLEEPLSDSPSFYRSWLESLKRYKSNKEFKKTAAYLIDRL